MPEFQKNPLTFLSESCTIEEAGIFPQISAGNVRQKRGITMPEKNIPTSQEDQADEALELYTLVDEEGNEKLFELIDVLEEDGKVYFALIQHVEDFSELQDDECELVVLNVSSDEDGSDILIPIESDEEYERIAQIFIERLEEDCDCEDEDCECHHHN